MPAQPLSTRILTALLLTGFPFVVLACGGSVEISASNAGAAGSDVGGQGGQGSGGTGNGGGGACFAACPAIGCGPGFKSVLEPGACCPSCVPDGSGGSGGGPACEAVDCALITCGRGLKFVSTPGACCGTCVSDLDACSNEQSAYQSLRKMLLSAASVQSCLRDSDCTLLASNANCGNACAADPVNVQSAQVIGSQLSQFAIANCSSCPVILPPCIAPLAPQCVAGQCRPGGSL